jgi:heat shock protein HtpX
VRRKDLAVPQLLELEPDLARAHNRRRIVLLDATFAALVLAEAAGLWLTLRGWWPLVVLVAGVFLIVARRHADSWIRHAMGAHAISAERLQRLLRNVARSVQMATPTFFVARGERPNAIALGSRRPWVAVTTGALDLDDLVLEGILAHEIVHLRDHDAAVASTYAFLAGAPDLAVRGFGAHAGVLALLTIPVWPAAIVLRLTRRLWFAPDREHRADIAAALLTRYPPGMAAALRAAAGARTAGPRLLEPFWFAPRDGRRAELVGEM